VKWFRDVHGQRIEVPIINNRVEKDAFPEPVILDGPADIPHVYGFEACRNLKKKRPGQSTRVADCQAILALALSLQFQHKYPHFRWVTGSVNFKSENGWLDYSPRHAMEPHRNQRRAVAPVGRSLRTMRDTTEKANVFKKRGAICLEGVDEGYTIFVA
jgi:hypothetical protein